jgi:hypothetical protein
VGFLVGVAEGRGVTVSVGASVGVEEVCKWGGAYMSSAVWHWAQPYRLDTLWRWARVRASALAGGASGAEVQAMRANRGSSITALLITGALLIQKSVGESRWRLKLPV